MVRIIVFLVWELLTRINQGEISIVLGSDPLQVLCLLINHAVIAVIDGSLEPV